MGGLRAATKVLSQPLEQPRADDAHIRGLDVLHCSVGHALRLTAAWERRQSDAALGQTTTSMTDRRTSDAHSEACWPCVAPGRVVSTCRLRRSRRKANGCKLAAVPYSSYSQLRRPV